MLLFESFNEIESICQKYGIRNYTINPDGTVDVDGPVNLSSKNLTEIPLKFGRVTSGFYCSENKLTSLEGCPEYVGGYFNCEDNKLTTLEGSPEYVGGDFDCSRNQLTTLKGSPKEVVGGFNCLHNQLFTLEGGPNLLGGKLNCEGNPVHEIFSIFRFDYNLFQNSMDYNYLRGSDIVKYRFIQAIEEININYGKKSLSESDILPDFLYKWIIKAGYKFI